MTTRIPLTFSSTDSLEQAAIFYIAIGSQTSFDNYMQLLKPFFGCSWVSVFSEIAIFRALQTFYLKTPSVDSIICQVLDSCSKNLKYLPQQHLLILSFVNNHWGAKKTYEFLVKVLIWPQLRLRTHTTPFLHIDKVPAKTTDLREALNLLEPRHMAFFQFEKSIQSVFSTPRIF